MEHKKIPSLGKISLVGGGRENKQKRDFAEGNVYLDEQPVCDDQWDLKRLRSAVGGILFYLNALSRNTFLFKYHMNTHIMDIKGAPKKRTI